MIKYSAYNQYLDKGMTKAIKVGKSSLLSFTPKKKCTFVTTVNPRLEVDLVLF